MNNTDLISVIVVSYKSEKFVVETLESVKRQGYKNIELIITDDASTDNTVSICKAWLEDNGDSFVRYKLVEANVNTGTAENCNRGISASNGMWIKFIAADDILFDDCLEKFLAYTYLNTKRKVDIIAAKSLRFFDANGLRKYSTESPKYFRGKFFNMNTSAEQQYKMLLDNFFIYAPSVLIRREALIKIGGLPTKYPLIEDYPLFLQLTKNGYKIEFLNENVVYYRTFPEGRDRQLAIKQLTTLDKIKLDHFKEASILRKGEIKWHMLFKKLLSNNNQIVILHKLFYYIFRFNPFYYIIMFRMFYWAELKYRVKQKFSINAN